MSKKSRKINDMEDPFLESSEISESSDSLEISEIEEKSTIETEKVKEIEIEIEKNKKKLKKVKASIEAERKKLNEIKKKSDNKNTEYQNLMLKIMEKKGKYKDIIDEDSFEDQKGSLEQSSHLDKIELKYLFREMENYIDNAYLDSGDVYKNRIESEKDIDAVTFEFFRTKERIDNCILIFQYLIFFGKDVEFPIADIEALTKHYKQFKDTIISFFNQIDENDVKIAIYREMINSPEDEVKKKEDFDFRIKEMQKMIKKRIIKTDKVSEKNLFELFNIFMDFLIFWFEIKNYDVKKLRKSDIFTYYLLKHLISMNNVESG